MPGLEVSQLALKLAEALEPARVERAARDRRQHGAARLGAVLAVRERHCPARSSTSSNACSRPSPASQSTSSRIPGVSIRQPPVGSTTSSRWVVVWRPRPSARSSAVASRSLPARRFTSVDLPTPDGPTRVPVRPPSRWATRCSMPSPVTADTAYAGTPRAMSPTRASASGTFSHRSDFVSTTTGSAPLSHDRVRYRSSRRGFRGPSSDATAKTTSTFAATTCSVVSKPATLRRKAVRRGSTASMVARSAWGWWLKATQSPTAGSSATEAARWRSRPGTSAQTSPAAVSRTRAPRCSTATRPGSRPESENGWNAAATAGLQPRCSRFTRKSP